MLYNVLLQNAENIPEHLVFAFRKPRVCVFRQER